MSTYSLIEGLLTYRTPEALEQAALPLRKGGWLSPDNTLFSDGDTLADENNPVVISDDRLTLRLPHNLYLNMGKVSIKKTIFDGVVDGFYKEFCEDGCLHLSSYTFGDNSTELTTDFEGLETNSPILKNLEDIEMDSLVLCCEDWADLYAPDVTENEGADLYGQARASAALKVYQNN